MRGLMQDWPLLCHKLIDYAAKHHGGREVISRSVEGPIHRTNYRELRSRALRCAKRLDRDGFRLGDRAATLAWNHWRHLEVWYGLLGIGGIYHTVNPRLFPEQIAWIINDAEDRLLFVDPTFLPLVDKIRDQLATIEKIVVLSDVAGPPQVSVEAEPYEGWLAADADFIWRVFDENTAAGMCYTSGTTGNPKGVIATGSWNISGIGTRTLAWDTQSSVPGLPRTAAAERDIKGKQAPGGYFAPINRVRWRRWHTG